jgi:serine protease Do
LWYETLEEEANMSERLSRSRWSIWIAGVTALALIGGAIALSLPGGVAAENPKNLSRSEATSYAQNLSAAFREAADQVLPSVVTIRTMPVVAERSSDREPSAEGKPGEPEVTPFGDFEGFPFGELERHPELRRFFEQMPELRKMPSPRGPRHGRSGIGSGVIIDPSGVILTNNHVVAGGGKIVVRLYDGREFEGAEVRTDPKSDLAVVMLDDAEDLPAARLGDSEQAKVGDWVLALGQPFGLEATVTAGIVSAKGRGLGLADRENFIQTDAAINPGNSGGPLVNLAGEVVGINTAISSRSGGYQGVGFAVPVNLAKWVADQLVDEGAVRRAYLGVMIQPVNHKLAERFDVEVHQGVVVTQVMNDTPAEKAGLKPGDVIVEFNGEKVTRPNQLQGLVERTKVNSNQSMLVVRDGDRIELNVKVEKQPEKYGLRSSAGERPSAKPEASQFDQLGLDVETLTPEVAKRLKVKVDEGAVITRVHPGSPAANAGLKTGMVIVEADRKPVTSAEDLEKLIGEESLSDGLLLLVRSAQGSQFVVLSGE